MSAKVVTLPVSQQGKLKLVEGRVVVSTVSWSDNWSRGLSPFYLGPVRLWAGHEAKNVENAWQYSKVYEQHLGADRNPTPAWLEWAMSGWAKEKADRYPMGRGAVPAFSWWNGRRLDYVAARKAIYGPLYRRAVEGTEAYRRLRELYEECTELVLLDFDVRDTRKTYETYTQVLNNDRLKMGHGFVLAMMLTGDAALSEFETKE